MVCWILILHCVPPWQWRMIILTYLFGASVFPEYQEALSQAIKPLIRTRYHCGEMGFCQLYVIQQHLISWDINEQTNANGSPFMSLYTGFPFHEAFQTVKRHSELSSSFALCIQSGLRRLSINLTSPIFRTLFSLFQMTEKPSSDHTKRNHKIPGSHQSDMKSFWRWPYDDTPRMFPSYRIGPRGITDFDFW